MAAFDSLDAFTSEFQLYQHVTCILRYYRTETSSRRLSPSKQKKDLEMSDVSLGQRCRNSESQKLKKCSRKKFYYRYLEVEVYLDPQFTDGLRYCKRNQEPDEKMLGEFLANWMIFIFKPANIPPFRELFDRENNQDRLKNITEFSIIEQHFSLRFIRFRASTYSKSNKSILRHDHGAPANLSNNTDSVPCPRHGLIRGIIKHEEIANYTYIECLCFIPKNGGKIADLL
ncbi:Protein CBG27682 [Caenorhabditis briggsae]|uniref:Protein CBG27682 n=1 Tax=Caenorhabditis briggsae TaxID=6238 RepID=B6IJC7_CAEBR|nr:Protein CBG27682 [Caenorhabditis briggsae]CAR99961.1 Protein CBG27682 [Caenorhabditis briggsae]